MIIKNIDLPHNGEIYINRILVELCRKNISYVYIKDSKELHFDKYVIHFVFKEIVEIEKTTSDINSLLWHIFNIANNKYLSTAYEPIIESFNYKDTLKKITKKNLKEINKITNQKIKNNDILGTKYLKKQLYPIRKMYK